VLISEENIHNGGGWRGKIIHKDGKPRLWAWLVMVVLAGLTRLELAASDLISRVWGSAEFYPKSS
jgi:hypothetical protein